MANPFEVAVPNVLQSLMAGEQSYKSARDERRANDISAVREEAAKGLMNGGDPKQAIARLLGVGDIQGAHTLATLGQSDRDFQFRTQESQRAQSNADRAFAEQRRQSDLAAKGFDYREIDDGNGNKVLVRIDKQGGAVTKPPIAGAPETPNNPYAYGKMNETQGKDAGYANRMFQSEGILRDPKLMEASQSLVDRAADRVLPGDIANKFVTSEGYQKYDQAARDFINATLRRESGAAISASEFDNAYKQYLPRPGDSKDLLMQKARNRQATIASIAGGGGQNYKPPFTFDQSGNMVATRNAQQGVVAAPQTASVPPGSAGAAGAGPPKVTQQGYAALPPGTQYIAADDPSGQVRTKQ